MLLHCRYYSDKAGAAPATAPAAPTAPQTVKKLDNLFFIEEPKSVHVVESKLMLSAERCRCLFMISVKMLNYMMESHHILDYRGYSYLHC